MEETGPISNGLRNWKWLTYKLRSLRGEVIWKHILLEYSVEGGLCKDMTHLEASI